MTPNGHRITVSIKLSVDEAAQMDAERGTIPRGTWCRDRLAFTPAAEDDTRNRSRRPPAVKGGQDGSAGVRKPQQSSGLPGVAAPRGAQPSPPQVVFSPPVRSPIAPATDPAVCKHKHVAKGWCNECKTGGH